jgi:transcriptional regulator GlxA family with amidase domain
MRIALLAVDGLFDSGLTAVLDILATANALRAETGVEAAFHVVPVGVGDSVTTHHGMRLAVTPLAEVAEALDLVIMSAVGFRPPDQVIDAVRGHAVLEWVTSFHNQGIPLAAACSGTFFLAEAGVLDGVTATTSWWLGRAFRSRYPRVDLDESCTTADDRSPPWSPAICLSTTGRPRPSTQSRRPWQHRTRLSSRSNAGYGTTWPSHCV